MERRALATIFATLVLTGCAQPGAELAINAETTQAADVVESPNLFAAPENLQTLIYEVRSASYVVDCGESYGSGFGFRDQSDSLKRDYVITTHAVIKNCLAGSVSPVLIDSNLNTFSATILLSESKQASDLIYQNVDLAILVPESLEIKTLRESAPRVQTGHWVLTGSLPALAPSSFTFAATQGSVISQALDLGHAIDAVTNPGSNGGVVVNSRGEILGTLYTPDYASEVSGVKYFLPISQVQEALDSWRDAKVKDVEELSEG